MPAGVFDFWSAGRSAAAFVIERGFDEEKYQNGSGV